MTATPSSSPNWAARWQQVSQAFLRAFHRYANWLVGITWKRFILLSVALMIVAAIVPELPMFKWRVTETIEAPLPRPPRAAPVPPVPPAAPSVRIERPSAEAASGSQGRDGVTITIDERGVRVVPRAGGAAASAASPGAASAAASAAGSTTAGSDIENDGITITLPPGLVDREVVRDAVREARDALRDVLRSERRAAERATEKARGAEEAARAAEEAAREAEEAAREAIAEAGEVTRRSRGTVQRTRTIRWADFITDLALLWVLASAIIKATYKGRLQAEVKAAAATETAEAESLKRQVVEARMAAMQAQVEPHFLFNTLASIDHLIETDPARASQMQKNLIALLRASMPTMRETSDGGVRDLARELQVIRPYLEILKVRMEERLVTRIDVPDGLLSAEFPPMMMQTLVENAIKHGLEPKAEGGSLVVKAEIVHGKLQVSVADTGLGFGRAATSGTGVGLANVRERLQLLHGPKASLTVAENPGGGTIVTITVPYRSITSDAA
ncbi:sensor histidine kinase [Pseudorhodoferax sp.]|uniref:sensor histidine kinase n=1 Tax=Pseudorhodoferax sp. TaxID=1993553 RepID=UPI002DD66BF1|nr:histidine kinase [Pseudorhodoferax sp.]